jgi:hypothetical protein
MVKAPRRRTYVNGAMAFIDTARQEKPWFPGGYYFDVPKDASAVYIGTLRFYRDDFNSITRVEVVDERKDIRFILKAGASPADVRVSLLKAARQFSGSPDNAMFSRATGLDWPEFLRDLFGRVAFGVMFCSLSVTRQQHLKAAAPRRTAFDPGLRY